MRADGSPNPDDLTHEDTTGQPMETIHPETGGPLGGAGSRPTNAIHRWEGARCWRLALRR
jgi:hypothetical protein